MPVSSQRCLALLVPQQPQHLKRIMNLNKTIGDICLLDFRGALVDWWENMKIRQKGVVKCGVPDFVCAKIADISSASSACQQSPPIHDAIQGRSRTPYDVS